MPMLTLGDFIKSVLSAILLQCITTDVIYGAGNQNLLILNILLFFRGDTDKTFRQLDNNLIVSENLVLNTV